uniref:BCL2 interacting protein 1a n=1 Tax=Haplochromis burtoni TaxID=8153 RepID=A0A3Q2UYB8_HAPBU
MASSDVHVRICEQEILKYDLEIKALIQDISECTGPQSKLTELNGEVKKNFLSLRLRIQDFEQMAMEQDKESDKQALMTQVEGHRKQMLSNQTTWRKANLASKLTIDNMEKQALLNGADDSVRQRKMTKEGLAQTTSDITENLMSISRMMAQQVQQSEETITSLVCSVSAGVALQQSRKAPKSTSSVHTGRDRTACSPAFLQIRPGKADYSNLFPSPFPA